MIRTACLAALTLLVAGSAAHAQSLAVGATVGTPGVGVEAAFRLGPVFTLRAGLERLNYDFDTDYDGVDYGAAFDFDTVGAFVDMHPFANGFMVSGGAYMGDRKIRLEATPTTPVEIGGQTYSPSQVGTLSGAIALSDVSPFFGVGYDDTFTRTGRWGFRAVVGVAWSDQPSVTLDSEGGSLSNNGAFNDRLDAEAREIEEDADGYGLFPVLQMGVNYRF